MKKMLTLAAVLLLGVAGNAFAEIHGAWTASTETAKPGRIHLNIVRGGWQHNGNTLKLADFGGLSDAQIHAAAQTPVQFRIVREAGTLQFDGTFRNGDGAGQFTFDVNGGYADAVRALGVAFELKRHRETQNEESQLFTLALMDVSTAFIRSMQAEGYNVTLDKYLSMRMFDVTPEHIRELRALGFRDLSAQEVISTRIHDVSPAFIRQMRAAGWNLSLKELTSSRIHGATPEFAEEMKRHGYGDLRYQDLVSFRIHGVTAEFIRELKELGYTDIPAKKLIQMKIHGIDASYVRKMNSIE